MMDKVKAYVVFEDMNLDGTTKESFELELRLLLEEHYRASAVVVSSTEEKT